MRKTLLPLLMMAFAINSQAQNYAVNFTGALTAGIGQPIPTNSAYTKEAWVYLPIATLANNIVSSQNTPFWIATGQLQAGQAGSYSLVVDPNQFPLSRWTHVAVTYNAGTMILYRNGIQVASATGVPAYTAENTFIGSHNGAISIFTGYMDEVRIWSVARTPAQIRYNMLRPPALNETGLVSYYNLNTGTGTSLINVSTNSGGQNGLLGASSWIASPVQWGNNAISLDGVNDYIDMGNSASVHPTGAMTWEIIVKSPNWAATAEQEIVSTFEGGGYGCYIKGGNFYYELRPTGSAAYKTISYAASNLTNNQWYHFAGTWDGRWMRLYVNGVEVGNMDNGSSTTIYYAWPNNNMMLGADAFTGTLPAGAYFVGQLDEFRLWNVARTPAQILANYNAQINVAAQTGLVSYYGFNEAAPGATNVGMTTIIDQAGNNTANLFNFDMTGTTSNFVAQNAAIVDLPVSWLSFTAQQQDGNVVLQWVTAQEANTLDFIVQHSTDGTNYTNVGTVAAAGNSTTTRNYGYTHTHPQSGVNYYRIAQRDIDGKSSYSQVRTVNIGSQSAPFVVLNNPVVNGSIRLQVNEPVQVQLFNQNGQQVFNKRLEPGIVNIDASSYAKGVYWLKAGTYGRQLLIQ